ncbi:MAG: type II toxin-antitoxin system Phd/YefM family antitoxin [Firmicutes bacterium]|nr:type II toxin-antitoxin system Phd/YefM family antitoxin [Bacillota bacterium]
MKEVGAYEAKTHLAELLDEVSRGEEITITRHGVPVAVLKPVSSQQRIPPTQAIARLRQLRDQSNAQLNGMPLKELIEEGRM